VDHRSTVARAAPSAPESLGCVPGASGCAVWRFRSLERNSQQPYGNLPQMLLLDGGRRFLTFFKKLFKERIVVLHGDADA
jgi:hypothetical protein